MVGFLDAFMDYVNGHNMIELIEHLCDRYDKKMFARHIQEQLFTKS